MTIGSEYVKSVSAFVIGPLVIFLARQASPRQTTSEMAMTSWTPPSGSVPEDSSNELVKWTSSIASDLTATESEEESQLSNKFPEPSSPKELPSEQNSSHEIYLTQSDDETKEREIQSPSSAIKSGNGNTSPGKLPASAAIAPVAPSNVSFPSPAAVPTKVMTIIHDVTSLAPDDEAPQYAYKHLYAI